MPSRARSLRRSGNTAEPGVARPSRSSLRGMLRLCRVTFFLHGDGCSPSLSSVSSSPRPSNVPEPIAVRLKPSNDTLVGHRYRLRMAVDPRLRWQATGQSSPDDRLVPQQARNVRAHGVRHVWLSQLVAEMGWTRCSKTCVSANTSMSFGAAVSSQIERLVTAADPHAGRDEPIQRALPQPRVPRFVGAVPRQAGGRGMDRLRGATIRPSSSAPSSSLCRYQFSRQHRLRRSGMAAPPSRSSAGSGPVSRWIF